MRFFYCVFRPFALLVAVTLAVCAPGVATATTQRPHVANFNIEVVLLNMTGHYVWIVPRWSYVLKADWSVERGAIKCMAPGENSIVVIGYDVPPELAGNPQIWIQGAVTTSPQCMGNVVFFGDIFTEKCTVNPHGSSPRAHVEIIPNFIGYAFTPMLNNPYKSICT
ncbi:MAG TPA: hypothetical protein VGG89_00020 [Candidatus Baltobacteraceae bacterium]